MPSFNLADLFEIVADAVPDRPALVAGSTRSTYRELDERSNRVAHHLARAGIGPGDRVALLSHNRAEWLEAQIGAFKLRAVPVNVNYRYTAGELAHVIADSGSAALVGERSLIARLGPARSELTGLRHVVVLEDGSGEETPGAVPYEAALANAPGSREGLVAPGTERSGDDLYLLYTGGTTGLPKGVMWRSEDIFFAAMGGGNMIGEPVTTPGEVGANALAGGLTILVTAPLMHGAGMWVAWAALTSGGTLVLWSEPRFTAEGVLALAARESAQVLVLVGDAMARPIADLLDQAGDDGKTYDLSALFAIATGGSITSHAVKQRLQRRIPSLLLILDAVGGSETGAAGQGIEPAADGAPRFLTRPDVAVLDESLRPVAPGSGEVGVFARSGRIPLGYWNDEAKTAKTFVTDDAGRRWALQGDMARVDEDGNLVLLGRGSLVVNTGGEKVFVEEVEAALKSHPAVYDALVVGVPDERLGSRVNAVVSVAPERHPDTASPAAGETPRLDLDELREHCRKSLAGYKVPREIHLVPEVRRSPAGKADYRWARDICAG
ncbi:acyl-CoA synthetase [Actinomadura scrupuli]|uniref:acyl-CoA synthetase n=1 Tax=Actinomadura scrupuli TaxID=559629 RepID=UPI003D95CA8C